MNHRVVLYDSCTRDTAPHFHMDFKENSIKYTAPRVDLISDFFSMKITKSLTFEFRARYIVFKKERAKIKIKYLK